jgi:hypothetical protein
MASWQEYWKGILGFLVPGAVVIGSSVLSDSDGGTSITGSEWVTAIVAMIVTGAAVTLKGNAAAPTATPPVEPPVVPQV